ncbi:MAG: lamin tail domain-containing protein, partial [Rhizobacter sp.]|nr:lamin tail domain-containing protein [Chlorobiales bacterium]
MTRTCSSVFTLGLALMLLSTLAAAQPKSNRAQAAVDTSVVFSEIMYDPPSNGTNDEYLEVFNTSTTTSINLSGWKIGGSVTNPVTLSDTGTGQTTLAPQSYAVILGSGYFSGGARAYQNAIPAGTLVMKTSAGLSLNNGSDNLRLITASNDTVASLTYTGPSDAQGKSLEKILLNRNDAATNYALSITGGTPGTKNSVASRDRDAAHIRLMFTPSDSVPVGTSALLTSTVKNLGLLALTNFTVDFYEDANANTQLEAAEKFDTKSFSGSLAQNDSASVTANILTPAAGTRQFGAVIVSAGDEFSGNDTLRAALKVYVPITNNPLDTNLIVSEIMYAPTSPQPEFLELFNKSTNAADSIKLNGLRIGDRATLSQVIKDGGVNLFLKSQQYAVVFANGNLATGTANYVIPASALTLEAGADLSLNNSGDSVVVINASGTTLSRFFYADTAAPAGKSSEKIAPTRTDSASNFAASVAASGSTPGARNSVTAFDRNLSVQTNAAFFTPPATPVNLTYNVINRGLQPFGNSATVRLFKDDDKNNLPDASEQINLFTLTTNLNPKDTLKSSFAFTPASQDSVNFIFTLTVAGDEDTTNNLA